MRTLPLFLNRELCGDDQNVARIWWWSKIPRCIWRLEEKFARDVTTIGHFGTGNLEPTLSSKADVEKARHLIEISYEAN